MQLYKILALLPRNRYVIVFDEFGRAIYTGYIWSLDSKYILSCEVVNCFNCGFYDKFIIIY